MLVRTFVLEGHAERYGTGFFRTGGEDQTCDLLMSLRDGVEVAAASENPAQVHLAASASTGTAH